MSQFNLNKKGFNGIIVTDILIISDRRGKRDDHNHIMGKYHDYARCCRCRIGDHWIDTLCTKKQINLTYFSNLYLEGIIPMPNRVDKL